MKLTLRIAASILILAGIVTIIVGAVAFEIKIIAYISVGVLLLVLGFAGFYCCIRNRSRNRIR